MLIQHGEKQLAVYYSGALGSKSSEYGGDGTGWAYIMPVVCLNSEVQLEKKIDGTYAIR